MTNAAGPVLWLTAQALAEVDHYTGSLDVEGYVYISGKRGMRRPHPAVQLRDAAWRRALAGLRTLGLSPTDRHRVTPAEPPGFLDVVEVFAGSMRARRIRVIQKGRGER